MPRLTRPQKITFAAMRAAEAERDLVLGFAIGGDAAPVALDHVGEALGGFEALPFEALTPVVEKAPGPALVTIVPELAESLLEQVAVLSRLLAASSSLSARLPSRLRFSCATAGCTSGP
jgi:hypothetical protein